MMHPKDSGNGSESPSFEVLHLSLFLESGVLPSAKSKGSSTSLAAVALASSILAKEDVVWISTVRALHR